MPGIKGKDKDGLDTHLRETFAVNWVNKHDKRPTVR